MAQTKQRRKVTGIYDLKARRKFDLRMAQAKSYLSIIMYAFGFLAINFADIWAGGATMSKGLVSAVGPGMGWTLAIMFSGAFGFTQLVLWNKIMDLRNKDTNRDYFTLIPFIVFSLAIAVFDTVIDTASIPLWLSTGELETLLAGVTWFGYDVYPMVYHSLILAVSIATGIGELIIITYFDSSDEPIAVQEAPERAFYVDSTKEVSGRPGMPQNENRPRKPSTKPRRPNQTSRKAAKPKPPQSSVRSSAGIPNLNEVDVSEVIRAQKEKNKGYRNQDYIG